MTFNHQVRRATIDDLVLLRRLWRQAGFTDHAFDKSFTDFQVIETASGDVLGALGLHIDGQHGRIYGEVFARPESAADLRPRLWDRLLTLARQRQLTRLWIESGSGQFWLEQGFEAAGSELLDKLPAQFGSRETTNWLTLQVREESESRVRIDVELALFRQAQIAESEKALRQARALRALAWAVVVLLVVTVGCAGIYIVRRLHGS